MGIGFHFTLQPKRKLLSKKNINRQTLISTAKSIAIDKDYLCRIYEQKIFCELCVEGYLWLEMTEGLVKGDCQTNVAGPGFHVAAIEYLERLAYETNLTLQIDDETGYFIHRDFNKMRQEHFYPWFNGLMQLIVDQEEQTEGSRYLCWPLGYYLPDTEEASVITPIRRFSFWEIKGMLGSGMFVGFAKEFFVWNEQNREASFYRNSALVRMNKECFFMPSSRSEDDKKINENIIRLLEMSLVLDRSLPFPVKEYLELCSLAEYEPMDVTGLSALVGTYGLGYRKGLVCREFGCIRFVVPGHYLMDTRSENKSTLFYDGVEENWHNYQIVGYESKEEATFVEELFEQDKMMEQLSFPIQDGFLKAAVYGRNHEDGDYGKVCAQIIYQKQLTVITISYAKEETEWALALLNKIQTIKQDEGEKKDE